MGSMENSSERDCISILRAMLRNSNSNVNLNNARLYVDNMTDMLRIETTLVLTLDGDGCSVVIAKIYLPGRAGADEFTKFELLVAYHPLPIV